MGELKVKDKDIVIPGEILATGMDYLPAGAAIREKEEIVASHLGIVSLKDRLVKVIPLTGRYFPKKGDTVIGKIIDITFSSWIVEIGCSNRAVLNVRDATSDFIERGEDLRQYFTFGDYIVAEVLKYSPTQGAIDLSTKGPGLHKITKGKIIRVTPSKVPRIIGKQGSMISLIKDATACRIIVGQNGTIWISGEDIGMEQLAEKAILAIEEKSHTSGLTEEIKKLLDEGKPKKAIPAKKPITQVEAKKPIKKKSEVKKEVKKVKK